jgi:hypothetical protein
MPGLLAPHEVSAQRRNACGHRGHEYSNGLEKIVRHEGIVNGHNDHETCHTKAFDERLPKVVERNCLRSRRCHVSRGVHHHELAIALTQVLRGNCGTKKKPRAVSQ